MGAADDGDNDCAPGAAAGSVGNAPAARCASSIARSFSAISFAMVSASWVSIWSMRDSRTAGADMRSLPQ